MQKVHLYALYAYAGKIKITNKLLFKVLSVGFAEMTQLKLVFHSCTQEDQADGFSGAS